MPGREDHPGPPDQLLRGALEVALAVVRRRLSDDPPVPAPRRLVPFLGFARLPDRALAAFRRVLDDDEMLRRATRDAADEDAIGRPSWLFLDRPVRWEDELDLLAGAADVVADEARDRRDEADVRRRLHAEASARRRADEEVARLGQEVGGAKELLAAERRARHRAETDAGRLRRRLSDLAADIEEGHRTQARPSAVLDEVGAGAATSAPDAGVRPSGSVPPQEAQEQVERRDEPVVDLAALTEAVEAATSATEVLSAALVSAARLLTPAVPGPGTAAARPSGPGDRSNEVSHPRRQPVPLPPGTFDDSVAAAEHLMRVPGVFVLVDGYNVTKLARPHLSLAEQRGWLVDAAVELAARSGASLEIVFDGAGERGSAPADLARRVGVQVRFSPEGTEADDLLLDLATATPSYRAVVVASDDRRVQHGALQLGANVISSPQLLAVANRPL